MHQEFDLYPIALPEGFGLRRGGRRKKPVGYELCLVLLYKYSVREGFYSLVRVQDG